jgi:hypothetical protein
MSARKVTLHGRQLWALDADEEPGDYPLAERSHCTANGELIQVFPVQESYAHVFGDGRIWRHQQVIGDATKDLVDGWWDQTA